MAKALTVRTIAMLAMPGVQLLDVSGPLDVFAEANVQAGFEAYRLLIAGDRAWPDRELLGRAPDARRRHWRKRHQASIRCSSPARLA